MSDSTNTVRPVCLSIAGLDPSGGAGILADIKAFNAFGCFGTAAVTSVTFQNTTGVFGAEHQSAESVRRQAEAVIEDFDVAAVKTGMLPESGIIVETARLITAGGLKNIVVDPVVRSTSGFDLIDDDALRSLIASLFPISDVITPNIPEAERITGLSIKGQADIEKAANIMAGMGARAVLIKGGHLVGNSAIDYLFAAGAMHLFESERIETSSTHGTGCVLSSSIAANLAKGSTLYDAVSAAKHFVTNAIRTSPNIGSGNSPINI